MAEIIKLSPSVHVPGTVSRQCKRHVKRLLRDVERGKVSSVGIIAIDPTGSVSTSFVAAYAQNHHLNSGISLLQHRFNNYLYGAASE